MFPPHIFHHYSQPARAKRQWAVNQGSRNRHVLSFGVGGRCTWWQQQAFSFSFSFLFFRNGRIICGPRLNCWCVLWLSAFKVRRKDGWSKWVGGGGGREECHGNTAFIIPSNFTPQLLGLFVRLIDASLLSSRLRSVSCSSLSVPRRFKKEPASGMKTPAAYIYWSSFSTHSVLRAVDESSSSASYRSFSLRAAATTYSTGGR